MQQQHPQPQCYAGQHGCFSNTATPHYCVPSPHHSQRTRPQQQLIQWWKILLQQLLLPVVEFSTFKLQPRQSFLKGQAVEEVSNEQQLELSRVLKGDELSPAATEQQSPQSQLVLKRQRGYQRGNNQRGNQKKPRRRRGNPPGINKRNNNNNNRWQNGGKPSGQSTRNNNNN
eukprot:scaffold10571_cov112-Skeletonema_menzelii.AAC.1